MSYWLADARYAKLAASYEGKLSEQFGKTLASKNVQAAISTLHRHVCTLEQQALQFSPTITPHGPKKAGLCLNEGLYNVYGRYVARFQFVRKQILCS